MIFKNMLDSLDVVSFYGVVGNGNQGFSL